MEEELCAQSVDTAPDYRFFEGPLSDVSLEKDVVGEELLPRAQSVETGPDYSLIVTFRNGERKKYDARPMLDVPMYKNLRKVFSCARVEHGFVVWPGDMDIDPDKLYLRSTAL